MTFTQIEHKNLQEEKIGQATVCVSNLFETYFEKPIMKVGNMKYCNVSSLQKNFKKFFIFSHVLNNNFHENKILG